MSKVQGWQTNIAVEELNNVNYPAAVPDGGKLVFNFGTQEWEGIRDYGAQYFNTSPPRWGIFMPDTGGVWVTYTLPAAYTGGYTCSRAIFTGRLENEGNPGLFTIREFGTGSGQIIHQVSDNLSVPNTSDYFGPHTYVTNLNNNRVDYLTTSSQDAYLMILGVMI